MAFAGEGLTGTEIQQVIYEVEARGQQALDELDAKLQAVDATLRRSIDDYRQGRINIDQFEQATRGLIPAQQRLTQQLAAGDVVLRRGADALDATGKRASAAARGVLEFSRGVEDLAVAGPLGVLNNVPTMFESIGRAVGLSATTVGALTAAVSLAATAAYILYQNWDRLDALLNPRRPKEYADSVEGLTQKVKDLRDAQDETVESTLALERAQGELLARQRELREFEQLAGARTPIRQESARIAAEAIVEAGGAERVEEKVAASLQARGRYFSAEERRRMEETAREAEEFRRRMGREGRYTEEQGFLDAESRARAEELAEARNRAIEAANQQARERVRRMIGGFAAGDEADRVALRQVVQADAAAFARSPLMFAVEASDPREIEARRRADRIVEEQARKTRERIASDAQLNADAARFEREGREENERQEQQAEREADRRADDDARALRDADRDAGRRADELARRFGTDDLAGRLAPAALRRMARGENEAAIEAALRDQLARQLVGAPGMDPGAEEEVAARIVRSVLEDLAPQLADARAALGPGAGVGHAAREVFRRQQQEAVLRGRRDRGEAERAQQAAAEWALTQQVAMANPGASPEEVRAVVEQLQRQQAEMLRLQAQGTVGFSALAQTNAALAMQIHEVRAAQMRAMARHRRGMGHVWHRRQIVR